MSTLSCPRCTAPRFPPRVSSSIVVVHLELHSVHARSSTLGAPTGAGNLRHVRRHEAPYAHAGRCRGDGTRDLTCGVWRSQPRRQEIRRRSTLTSTIGEARAAMASVYLSLVE